MKRKKQVRNLVQKLMERGYIILYSLIKEKFTSKKFDMQ